MSLASVDIERLCHILLAVVLTSSVTEVLAARAGGHTGPRPPDSSRQFRCNSEDSAGEGATAILAMRQCRRRPAANIAATSLRRWPAAIPSEPSCSRIGIVSNACQTGRVLGYVCRALERDVRLSKSQNHSTGRGRGPPIEGWDCIPAEPRPEKLPRPGYIRFLLRMGEQAVSLVPTQCHGPRKVA